MYDIVKLNMKECTFQVLYEHITIESDAILLAKYELTNKTNDEDIILILPHSNPLDINSRMYNYAKEELSKDYKAVGIKRHAFSIVEYAKSRRRRDG